MSKRRLSLKERQKDLDAFAALQAMEDYTPSNPAYTLAKTAAKAAAMQEKQTTEVQAYAAADGARDDATDSEWEFHDTMQNVDVQVAAQYGKDSNEYQSLGLKKTSEYKKKSGKKTPTT